MSESGIRTENAGDIFYCEYTTTPATPTYSDIEMYFASNDQTLPNDSDYDLDDSKAYYVSDTGTYTVYYKDNCTGVRSANFTLQIVEYVTGIGVPSSVRIEQKNVGFELDYSFTPTTSEYHSISLYYADTNTEVSNTGDTYTISTPGVYTVYYKDSYSGVESEEFTIEVYDLPTFDSKDTYMIQPVSHSDLYLTMENDSNSESNSLTLTAINYQPITYTNGAGPSQATANLAEDWDYISKTFTIESVVGNPGNYRISATLTTNQYGAPTLYNDYIDGEYMYEYQLRTLDSNGITNTLYYHNNNLCTKEKNNNYSQMSLWYVDGYYYILCGTNASSELLALKCVASSSNSYSIAVAPLIPGDASFQWTFTHVGVDVPLIKQTRNYVCGFTTLLQVMMGAGLDVTVNPNWIGTNGDTALDLDAKMKMIKDTVQPDDDNEAYQGSMAGYANTLLSHSIITGKENVDSITSIVCSDLTSGANVTDAQLAELLMDSMETGFAPFYLTRAAYSPYRYGSSYGAHYIAIVGVKYSNDDTSDNDFVILSNCHYNDNVFGVYVVSFEDFRASWLDDNNTGYDPYLYYFTYTNNGGAEE